LHPVHGPVGGAMFHFHAVHLHVISQDRGGYCEECHCHEGNQILFHIRFLLWKCPPYLAVYQNLALRVLPSFSWNLHITPYFPCFDRSKSAPKWPCMPIRSLD